MPGRFSTIRDNTENLSDNLVAFFYHAFRMLPQFKKWWDQNRHQIQNDYFDFLRFKSISTDPSFESEVRRCSAWVRDYLEKKVGWKAELIETEGYPLVYAENLQAGP